MKTDKIKLVFALVIVLCMMIGTVVFAEVEPVYVPGLEELGIQAISAELEPGMLIYDEYPEGDRQFIGEGGIEIIGIPEDISYEEEENGPDRRQFARDAGERDIVIAANDDGFNVWVLVGSGIGFIALVVIATYFMKKSKS
ncbi:MAG: hypothetical protein FWC79_02135 [Oscillospiraceae bacterium]|nr:hypothetical protein [Oscillospiraceae bacterium]